MIPDALFGLVRRFEVPHTQLIRQTTTRYGDPIVSNGED